MVGGPLSDKCVLFLVSGESSTLKTIVLPWLNPGGFRQTLTKCFALWSYRGQEMRASEEGDCCYSVVGGIACLLTDESDVVFWGPLPRPLS